MPAKSQRRKKRPRQPGKAHEDPVKASVIAKLLLGAGVMEVAAELELAHSTVSTYKAEIPEGKLDELRRKKGERLDELVFDYMITSLQSLRRQAEIVSDEEYIKKHGPAEVATLHGVMADKTLRLLEATTRARSDRGQLTDGETES